MSDKRDPEIRLHGRGYRASHFVEMIDGLTKKRGDRPSLLDELKASLVEAIRRDQEHDGDSLRGQGDGGPRGKGTHSDPTEVAALQEWDTDPVHLHAVKMCEYAIDMDLAAKAALSHWVKLNAYEKSGRESTLTECVNKACGKSMTGIGEDRARAGRCERCYRFLRRTGRDWTPNAVDGEDAA